MSVYQPHTNEECEAYDEAIKRVIFYLDKKINDISENRLTSEHAHTALVWEIKAGALKDFKCLLTQLFYDEAQE